MKKKLNTILFVGIEKQSCGSNNWAMELDIKKKTCIWGYHSKWMGQYDSTIETDGMLHGQLTDQEDGIYTITFSVPYLSEREYDELNNNTYSVRDDIKRKNAITKAKKQMKH